MWVGEMQTGERENGAEAVMAVRQHPYRPQLHVSMQVSKVNCITGIACPTPFHTLSSRVSLLLRYGT